MTGRIIVMKGAVFQGHFLCGNGAAFPIGVVIAELRICEGHRSPVLIQAAAVSECGIPVKQHAAGKVDCRGGIRVQATAIAALGSVIGKGKVRHGRVCPVGEKRAAGIAPRRVPIKGAIRHGQGDSISVIMVHGTQTTAVVSCLIAPERHIP